MPRLLSAGRTFSGRSALTVKRDVLTYWHSNQQDLGLSLRQFLSCCRKSGDGLTVTFLGGAGATPAGVYGAARSVSAR